MEMVFFVCIRQSHLFTAKYTQMGAVVAGTMLLSNRLSCLLQNNLLCLCLQGEPPLFCSDAFW